MADSTEDVQQPEATPPSTSTDPTPRHDWYQTQSDVIIDILAKRLKKEDVVVNFSEKTVSHSLVWPPSGSAPRKLW